MKLLLDQNLSRRMLPTLEQMFPGSSQVALLGLADADALREFLANTTEGVLEIE